MCDVKPYNIVDKKLKFDLPDTVKEYLDYRDMLKKEDIDLIAIATESGKHAQIALECIEAGCNLIIEKPIALSLEDADEIIKKADEKGVKICACHQNRFNKSIQKIREAVDNQLM